MFERLVTESYDGEISFDVSLSDELTGHQMRVMGAPIQAQIFAAIQAAPSAIAYNEVYNAIQTVVIAGFENEAASMHNLKIYEGAPHITLTRHAITVRPLVMSKSTFSALPEDLQAIILSAGAEAGAFGHALEGSQDGEIMQGMIDAGQVFVKEFENLEALLELVIPVQDAYAAELCATELLNAIPEQ